ncbi:uncharacterized protein [Ovis canadensis]|uniref:uncharacterized protein n=1 Tax=Ovis canadensis TaxID=37174 RepID=UPI003752E650
MMKSDGRSMTPGLRRRWTRAPGSAEETRPDSPPALKPAHERAAGTLSLLRLHQGGVATAGRALSPCAAGSQRIPCYLSNCTRLPAGFARAPLGRGRGRAAVRPGERRIQLRGSTVRPGKRFPQWHLLNLTRWFRHVRAPSMPSLIQAGLSSIPPFAGPGSRASEGSWALPCLQGPVQPVSQQVFVLLTEDCPRNLQQRVHGPGILSAYFPPKTNTIFAI